MNRKRHRSEQRSRRVKRAERSRHSQILSSLAELIRQAERRRRVAQPAEQIAASQ